MSQWPVTTTTMDLILCGKCFLIPCQKNNSLRTEFSIFHDEHQQHESKIKTIKPNKLLISSINTIFFSLLELQQVYTCSSRICDAPNMQVPQSVLRIHIPNIYVYKSYYTCFCSLSL